MRDVRGFSLVEVVVASALVLVATTVMLDSYLYSLKYAQVIQYHFRAAEIKENVKNLLKNQAAWSQMVGQNTFKNCFDSDSVTSCPPSPPPDSPGPAQGGFLFAVQRPDGRIYLDSTALGAGMDLKGKLCTDFQVSSADATCSLRAEVRWSPICSGLCTSGKAISQVRLDFALLGNASLPGINLSQYQFSLYKTLVPTVLPPTPPAPVIVRDGPWYIPKIAASEDGTRYLIVGPEVAGVDTHFRGMMLDQDGNIIRDVFSIETIPYCTVGDCASSYHIAANNVGNNFVAVWDDSSENAGPTRGVKMAILDSNGQLIRGPELLKTGKWRSPVFVGGFASGTHFAVIEADIGRPLDTPPVPPAPWLRVFQADGTPVGPEIQLNALVGSGVICGFAHAYQADQIQLLSVSPTIVPGDYLGYLQYFKKSGANWVFERTFDFPLDLYTRCWHDTFIVARSRDGNFLFVNQTDRANMSGFAIREIHSYRLPPGSSGDPIPEGIANIYKNSSGCNSASTATNWPGITPILRLGFLDSVIHYSRYRSTCYPTDNPSPGQVVVGVSPDGSIAKTFASAASPALSPVTKMDYKLGGTKFIISIGNNSTNDKVIIRLHPYEP